MKPLSTSSLSPSRRGAAAALLLALACGHAPAAAGPEGAAAPPCPVPRGLRVFTCGHSLLYYMPPILKDVATLAGIKDHEVVGLSAIGGSHVYAHWDVPDEKNKAKEALRAGKVDVLNLSPLHPPDEGIEKFARLAMEHNPDIRITVEEIWMPFDLYQPTFPRCDFPKKVDHNAATGPSLRALHEPYFVAMDAYLRDLNKALGKDVLLVVPAGQAVIALREKVIAGEAFGVKTQEELFEDPVGHPQAPLQALVAYCHYAVMYRQSPVGLPLPECMARVRALYPEVEKLNRLLQEIAWDAVTRHPLSGMAAAKQPATAN